MLTTDWDALLAARAATPRRAQVMHQRWENLLFLYWVVSPYDLRRTLPRGLAVDTCAGQAYVGLSPFFLCASTRTLRARLVEAMRPCLTNKCPFDNLPSSRTSHFGEGITTDEMKELCWVKPKLVAPISFTEWTNYGLLRHATFEGLREDKEPHAVVS